MFYTVLFILLIACCYWGQVLGLHIHCDNCQYFKPVQKYVYLVPFLGVAMTIAYVSCAIKEKKWKNIVSYFMFGNKSLIILDCMVDALPELKKNEQRKRVRQLQRNSRTLPIKTLRSIFSESQDRVESGFQQIMM